LRWDRIPRDASGELAEDFFEPPDVAVVIASLEQSVNGQVRRCLWYVSHGVHVALLVDPDDDSILAFRPGSSLTALTGTDLIDLSEVLPSFKLTVHELFESLRV
jgi:Uma2 family endonuclease